MVDEIPGETTRGAAVRALAPADVPAAAALLEAIYIGEGFTPESGRASLRAVAARAGAGDSFVAVDPEDDSLIGTVCLFLAGTLYSQVSLPGEAEVRLLAVDPAACQRGVGEPLMDACRSRAVALGASRIVLSTQPTMVAAHRLYGRLGFRRAPGRDWERPNSARQMLVYELELA
jgi:ribosomal protein S18 acetylase RimI-like enzyme